jgi:hypothetical protein
MFDLIRLAAGTLIFFGLCGLAIWRGGRPERIVAITLLVTMVITPLVQTGVGEDSLEVGMFLVDTFFMLVVFWVALTSDRWWPLFCAAFALLAAVSHVARTFNDQIGQFSYITATVMWSYGTVYALGAGVFELERRKRRLAAAAA